MLDKTAFLTNVDLVCLPLDAVRGLHEGGPVLVDVHVRNQFLQPFGVGKAFLPLFILLKTKGLFCTCHEEILCSLPLIASTPRPARLPAPGT